MEVEADPNGSQEQEEGQEERSEKCEGLVSESDKQLAEQWTNAIIDQGINVLFFGVGSKSAFVRALEEVLSSSSPVIRIDGTSPSLQKVCGRKRHFEVVVLREVIAMVSPRKVQPPQGWSLSTLWATTEKFLGPCAAPFKHMQHAGNSPLPPPKLVFIVENLDSDVFAKDFSSMEALARIAGLEGVAMVGTVESVYAPLSWSSAQRQKFSWTWAPLNTWAPFGEDVSKMPEIRKGKLADIESNEEGDRRRVEQLSVTQERLLEVIFSVVSEPEKIGAYAQKKCYFGLAAVIEKAKRTGFFASRGRVEENLADLERAGFVSESKGRWHLTKLGERVALKK